MRSESSLYHGDLLLHVVEAIGAIRPRFDLDGCALRELEILDGGLNSGILEACSFRPLHIIGINVWVAPGESLLLNDDPGVDIDLELVEVITVSRPKKDLDHGKAGWWR